MGNTVSKCAIVIYGVTMCNGYGNQMMQEIKSFKRPSFRMLLTSTASQDAESNSEHQGAEFKLSHVLLNIQKIADQKSTNSTIQKLLRQRLSEIKPEYDLQTKMDKLHGFILYEAPILMHFKSDVIPMILQNKDKHYKNWFELSPGKKTESMRAGWERNIFGTVYDAAENSDRVKYGCLNTQLKTEGCATNYGWGYFVLNDKSVRWRVSITMGDSARVENQDGVGTLRSLDHLLARLPKDELEDLVETAMHKVPSNKQITYYYREIQIHGPILFERDVVALHVPEDFEPFKQKRQAYEEFCKKFNCKLVWYKARKVESEELGLF